ncbi:MAG: cupin domain-containing protein [Geminicoccaceae bacterium]
MTKQPPQVVNIDDVNDIERIIGDHWGGSYKPLTPSMQPRGGRLGVNLTRVPPGRSACPFHAHQREDEVFYVLSGRGVFRYGDNLQEVGPSDCIACPAGTGIAHQLANPFDQDLTYLAIGAHDPDEVCIYPDNGKVMVRSLKRIGYLATVDYMEGEPDKPRIFDLIEAQRGRKKAKTRKTVAKRSKAKAVSKS